MVVLANSAAKYRLDNIWKFGRLVWVMNLLTSFGCEIFCKQNLNNYRKIIILNNIWIIQVDFNNYTSMYYNIEEKT